MQEEQVGAIHSRLGTEGLKSLAANFYRLVRDHPVLRSMYPEDDFEGAERRLCDFLIFRFGGPPTYIEQRGHPALRMRHAPFAIDQAARDAWIESMQQAIDELDCDQPVADTMREFFEATASFLINRR